MVVAPGVARDFGIVTELEEHGGPAEHFAAAPSQKRSIGARVARKLRALIPLRRLPTWLVPLAAAVKSLLVGGARRKASGHIASGHTRTSNRPLSFKVLERAKPAPLAFRPAGDNLAETRGWENLEVLPAPFVSSGGDTRVLLLNSMGGSMGRLSKALMRYHSNIEADCIVAAYEPRRHMTYPHETNVFGIFSHEEWRDYLKWAVGHYDIIQSTTFPLAPAVAELYDWLSARIGRRHIWRETGFIHNYIYREDVLPAADYAGHKSDKGALPDPSRFPGRTFRVEDGHFLTDPYAVFYSSPEKGAYLKGSFNKWLPSMRDPEAFSPPQRETPRGSGSDIKVYVPYHKGALWKGLDEVISALETLKGEGYPLTIVTSENAGQIFPDLTLFGRSQPENSKAVAYPVPNHLMPEIFRRVDFVVDQIIMGSYGNTGIEAMLCGCPVVGQKRYADLAAAPLWNVERATLVDDIRRFLHIRETWDELGRQGREFALKVHTPRAVSGIAAATYAEILDSPKF
ncbi:MAG TPA: hypothetical protein VMF90_25780 [Rhizobiaceae bacterium]|nr:hypothetical protein [Rhizobiaceae bacterium]